MVSLSSVDPQARQVLEARERLRQESICIVVRRLAAEGRIRQPCIVEQAMAVLIALTSFQTCDQMASLLETDFLALTEVLLPMIGAVVQDVAPKRVCVVLG